MHLCVGIPLKDVERVCTGMSVSSLFDREVTVKEQVQFNFITFIVAPLYLEVRVYGEGCCDKNNLQHSLSNVWQLYLL